MVVYMEVRYQTVVDLLSVHREVASALSEVRLSVASCDPRRSAAWFARLDALLRGHIRDEDTLLLPEYEARATDVPPFGSAQLIGAEHRRLEDTLSRCGTALTALCPGEATYPQRLTALLDDLGGLDDLLEHHDLRESRSLKPMLDALLPESVRRAMLDVAEASRAAVPELDPDDGPTEHNPLVDVWPSPRGAGGVGRDPVDALEDALDSLEEHRLALAIDAHARVIPSLEGYSRALEIAVDAVAQLLSGGAPERTLVLIRGQQRKLRILLVRAASMAATAMSMAESRARHVALLRLFDQQRTARSLLRAHLVVLRSHAHAQELR